jgi:hypothetical protein
LLDNGSAPELPQRPDTSARQVKSPPPSAPSPAPTQGEIAEQRRMLEEYEQKQKALVAQREADQRRQQDDQRRQEAEFAEQQRLQQERERQAQEQLLRDQMSQQWNQQQQGQSAQMEREMLAMQGQYERDQMLLEQYDRVSASCSTCHLAMKLTHLPEGEESRKRTQHDRHQRRRTAHC